MGTADIALTDIEALIDRVAATAPADHLVALAERLLAAARATTAGSGPDCPPPLEIQPDRVYID